MIYALIVTVIIFALIAGHGDKRLREEHQRKTNNQAFQNYRTIQELLRED